MQNKRKTKTHTIQVSKSKIPVFVPAEEGAVNSFEVDPDFWSKEIEAVSKASYASVEDAIAAIADKVVQRISSPTIDDRETKKFVTEFLSSNDEVLATLREVLHIHRAENN